MTIDSCFNLALRQSSRLITQFYEDHLSAVDLKVGQFSILRAVYYTKETTNKELQSILVLEQSTLTRNLKPLIRDGYLQLRPHTEDSRLKLISLTKSGKALYKRALPIWEAAQAELQKKVGAEEAATILALADTLVKTLGET